MDTWIEKGENMTKFSLLAAVLAAGAAIPSIAHAAGYTLFGSASYVSPGDASNRAVQLVADGNASPAVYSGIDFSVPAGLTINNLNDLETDYDFTASSCGVGSPRFGIQLSGYAGTIFGYIGPPPNYTGCPPNVWTPTGNLLSPASLVDSSQLPGGAFYDSWAAVQARYSGATVTDIFLVSDYGPAGSQTVLVDNTTVNGTLYDYEPSSKDDCKNGGWTSFSLPPGPFKNQGQCVSYFAQQQH
jgi:hypothetical protein